MYKQFDYIMPLSIQNNTMQKKNLTCSLPPKSKVKKGGHWGFGTSAHVEQALPAQESPIKLIRQAAAAGWKEGGFVPT
jgi:hypothetical protein